MEVSDSGTTDTEDVNDPLDHDSRLGKLLDRITNQENIGNKDKEHLIGIISRCKHCFGTSYEHLSQTNLVKFHVDTGNAKPIYKRPYTFLSNSEKQMLKNDLEDMVNSGILIPSTHVPSNFAQGG